MSEAALAFDCELLSARFSAVAGAPVFVAGGTFVSDQSPYVEERQLVTRAVLSRKTEFYSGRHFARVALAKAGAPAGAILRGDKGNPLWPTGFTGSITHDDQQVIAIVAAKDLLGVGTDLLVQPAKVESHLQPLIATDSELSALAKLYPAIHSLALSFSLKEAVVKAVSPGIDRYLDLREIQLLPHGDGCFARVLGFELSLDWIRSDFSPGIVTFASLSR